ncbi:MAG: Mut7-C RNAse domain-containing protein [Phenylobacterium sp.]|jgi:uncharacterized protein|uniref:Mut7-C RNAse domain-containing protein n=1 Tax=Phenylobacterium sp. TaxID=1871053 RepID=UPI00391BB73E
MGFLCDEMLARLARLLRAAGHDTLLATGGAPDSLLLGLARWEHRLLLTQDRRLAARAAPFAALVEGRSAMDQARSLSRAAAVDWRCAPFTRCLVDNARLVLAGPSALAAMPPEAQAGPGPFRACPICGRAYWPGSHVKRLAERLATLAGDD